MRPSECGGQSADGCEADCFQVVVGSRRGASDQEMKLELEPLLAKISVKPPMPMMNAYKLRPDMR